MSDPFDPYNMFLSIMSKQAVSDTQTHIDWNELFQQNEDPYIEMYLSTEDIERILNLPDNENQEGKEPLHHLDISRMPLCNSVIFKKRVTRLMRFIMFMKSLMIPIS